MNLEDINLTKGGNYRISQITGKFQDPSIEAQYLNSRLDKNIYLVRVFILMVIGITPLFAYFDQHIILPHFYPNYSLPVRIVNVLVLLFAVFRLRHIKCYQTYVRLISWVIISICTSLILTELMLDTSQIVYIQFDAIIIICLFAAPLLSSPRMAILTGVFSLLSVGIILFVKEFALVYTALGSMAYTFAFVIGYIISIHINFNHRMEFKVRQQLNAQSEQLTNFAYRDSLTGLHNRRAYVDHFPKYMDFAARSEGSDNGVFIIMADIDFFKKINDQYGHDTGDDVLTGFSTLLSSTIRPSDGLYRYGGEEFVIVLSQCPKEIAIERIEDIIKRLNNRELAVPDLDQSITSSFGMTQVLETDDCNSATARADDQLYEAKRGGRNRLVHD